jgi:hypothetical protein
MLLSMLSHESRALGSMKLPVDVSYICATCGSNLTLQKMRHKTMSGFVNQITLSCNTDSSENVVSSTHHLPDTRFGKLIKDSGRTWFQFVFKDDKAQKVETGLCILSLHLLNLDPIELLDVFRSTSYDAKPPMCVI